MTKLSQYLILFLAVTLMNCSTNNGIEESLTFIDNNIMFLDYELLLFKNHKDSLFFVLSPQLKPASNRFYGDSLVKNKKYLVKLNIVKKGIILKSIIRGHASTAYDFNDVIITKNDTLVGTVYTSPNINGIYYKK